MSRVGKLPIQLPSGVEVKESDSALRVKGPKGQLSTSIPAGIRVEIADGELRVQRADDERNTRALHGLTRALVANMVTGVTKGFHRELSIEGVGYRAEVSGKQLTLALGFSHPVVLTVPDGLSVTVDRNTVIRVEGIDRQIVGQFAANVRSVRPPEPYKGKGVRYSGEQVRRKVGKAGAV